MVENVDLARVGDHGRLEAKVVVGAKGVEEAVAAIQQATWVADMLSTVTRWAQPLLAHAAQMRLPVALHPCVARPATVAKVGGRSAQPLTPHILAQHAARRAQPAGLHRRRGPRVRVVRCAAQGGQRGRRERAPGTGGEQQEQQRRSAHLTRLGVRHQSWQRLAPR